MLKKGVVVSESTIVIAGVRKVVPLVLALVLILWSATAHAQTPTEAQYGDPTATSSGNIVTSSASAAGGGSSAEVLPATGGPLLSLGALGILALSATGLLVLREVGRR